MILVGARYFVHNSGIPRESGDDPTERLIRGKKVAYSPRERG